MASSPIAHDPTRRIINVHWRSGESPPGVFGVRIHGIEPIQDGSGGITIFPIDGHQALPNSQVSLTSPYPPGESPIQIIPGTISGAPPTQAASPDYFISFAFIQGDLTLGVVTADSNQPPGANITLFFDCSGYSFTDDNTAKTYAAHHLYVDTQSAISAVSLAMGPA